MSTPPRTQFVLGHVCVAALCLAALACGDANLTTNGARQDGGGASDADASDRGGTDGGRGDLGSDVQGDGEGDGVSGLGSLLDPCEEDDDCLSRYCIQFGEGTVCSELCTPTSCPDGWGCRIIENTGADAVRICVPNPSTLCSPCENNTDCGGRSNLCVAVGSDRVCGLDCTESNDICREGYVCSLRTDPAGAEGRQCVPDTERCSCRVDEDGNDRPCVRQNQFGVCEGIEVCLGVDGWSACTAREPIDEICDGVDNDCDGLTDENLMPRECFSTPNELGTCAGMERCMGTSGWICDAEPAAIETCDGRDNDCNGISDDGLCFDGNPCTSDVCNPDNPGECTYPPRAGDCDDEDACTINTICVDGACTGSQRDCDDGNGCTSDRCDRVAGCQSTNLSGTSCETGNFCTNDICQDGTCTTGPAVQCGGNSACRSASCNPATGCEIELLTGNPCDLDDACSQNDRCSNGECIPGPSTCTGTCSGECPGVEFSIGCIDLAGIPICTCICLG